jgi:DNA helicase-2/ATP-dependent DNA helicase PcrA
LAYVGVTRARERLYLVYAYRRSSYGGGMTNTPSRFIDDIPARLKRGQTGRVSTESASLDFDVESAVPAPRTRAGTETAPADVSFIPGDRIRHAKFGEGIVVSSVLARGEEEVTVAFPKIGVKKLAVSLAPLERL